MQDNQILYEVILVENNPLDAAVVDAIFEGDSRFKLRYTSSYLTGNSYQKAIDLNDLWLILENKKQTKPNIVLLDLALNAISLQKLTDNEFTDFLDKSKLISLSASFISLSKSKLFNIIELSVFFASIIDEKNNSLIKQSYVNKFCTKHKESKNIPEELHKYYNINKKSLSVIEKLGELFFDDVFGGGFEANYQARELAKAPSLFYMFALISSSPNVCFVILSHFASEKIRWALISMISSCYPMDNFSVKRDVFSSFVCNKGALFNISNNKDESFPERLIKSYEKWNDLLINRSYHLAPFTNIHIKKIKTRSDIKIAPLKTLKDLLNDFKIKGIKNRLVVIFDETHLLSCGWGMIAKSLLKQDKNCCVFTKHWESEVRLFWKTVEKLKEIKSIDNDICIVQNPLAIADIAILKMLAKNKSSGIIVVPCESITQFDMSTVDVLVYHISFGSFISTLKIVILNSILLWDIDKKTYKYQLQWNSSSIDESLAAQYISVEDYLLGINLSLKHEWWPLTNKSNVINDIIERFSKIFIDDYTKESDNCIDERFYINLSKRLDVDIKRIEEKIGQDGFIGEFDLRSIFLDTVYQSIYQ